MPAFDLETTYLSLDGKGAVAAHPVGPDFWATIDKNTSLNPTLITVFEGDSDWPHWEMHPEGDEILVQLEGRQTIIFDGPDGETRHPMATGSTLVIPAGVWHRAMAAEPTRTLFITYGAGTTHRPV